MARVRIHTNAPREIHLLLASKRLAIHRGVRDTVRNHAVLIQREIVRTMTHDPKTGRIYNRGGRIHQASAAGESPAVDTGNLVNNIRYALGNSGLSYIGRVYTNVSYARYLENGTRNMARRPAFIPSLNKYRSSFIRAITAMIENTG